MKMQGGLATRDYCMYAFYIAVFIVTMYIVIEERDSVQRRSAKAVMTSVISQQLYSIPG